MAKDSRPLDGDRSSYGLESSVSTGWCRRSSKRAQVLIVSIRRSPRSARFIKIHLSVSRALCVPSDVLAGSSAQSVAESAQSVAEETPEHVSVPSSRLYVSTSYISHLHCLSRNTRSELHRLRHRQFDLYQILTPRWNTCGLPVLLSRR